MASNPKDSEKIFGGSALPAGTYQIVGSDIVEETAKINGEEVKYDCLRILVADPSAPAVQLKAYLSLNGCWRPRRGSDGNAYQASGNLFDELLKACSGKTFNETRDYIKSTFIGVAGKSKFILTYKQYPSQSGGFGQVPIANFTV